MHHAVTLTIAGLCAAALTAILQSIARRQRVARQAALRVLTGHARARRRSGRHRALGAAGTTAMRAVCCDCGRPPAQAALSSRIALLTATPRAASHPR